jgi:cytochrome c554/c'-like protein
MLSTIKGRHAVAVAALLAALTVALTASPGSAQDPTPEYVGDKTCKSCHFKQHRAWKKTGLAKAVDTLKPTAEADDKALFDRKAAAKLDPTKDYSADATCLACHTTGYGKPGGYPADPAATDEAKALAELMGKVSCESCHGPGSLYSKHKEEKQKEDKKAKFTFEGLAKLGLVKPDDTNCATCHNDQGPTHASSTFDFEKDKAKTHPKKKKKKKKKD